MTFKYYPLDKVNGRCASIFKKMNSNTENDHKDEPP